MIAWTNNFSSSPSQDTKEGGVYAEMSAEQNGKNIALQNSLVSQLAGFATIPSLQAYQQFIDAGEAGVLVDLRAI